MKTELSKSKSEPEQLENPKPKVNSANNDFDKTEFELLLDEKDSKIQEYLKIINEKETQILSQKLCCPVCISDLDANKKMIAFYKCGHQACSKCFDELPVTNSPGTAHNYKHCPICKACIKRSIALADS